MREAEGRREIKYCSSNFIFSISNFQGRKGRSVEGRKCGSVECRLWKDRFSAEEFILVIEGICPGWNDCYSDVQGFLSLKMKVEV